MDTLLEICCDQLASALAAQEGGADRIELCAALSTDGLTPSAGLLSGVRRLVALPIFVLVRPRPGDFVYSKEEMEIMLCDIHQAKALGADGIVSGALTSEGRVDERFTQQLISAARPLPFTFHRAFDQIADQTAALDILIRLGAERVLTSGGAPSAVEGRTVLAALAGRAEGRITLLAGGGIRPANLPDLLSIPGLMEFHSSASADQEPRTADADIVRNMQRQMAAQTKRLH